MVVNQLKAEFFWRDSYKNEVDIVKVNKKTLPIEVKYGKIEIKPLLLFMKKFKVNKDYIISLKKEAEQKIGGRTVITLPAFKFLLEHNLDE